MKKNEIGSKQKGGGEVVMGAVDYGHAVRGAVRTANGNGYQRKRGDSRSETETMSDVRNLRTRTSPLLLVGLLGGMRPAVRMKRNNISIFYILYIRLNWWPWLSLVIGLYKR